MSKYLDTWSKLQVLTAKGFVISDFKFDLEGDLYGLTLGDDYFEYDGTELFYLQNPRYHSVSIESFPKSKLTTCFPAANQNQGNHYLTVLEAKFRSYLEEIIAGKADPDEIKETKAYFRKIKEELTSGKNVAYGRFIRYLVV